MRRIIYCSQATFDVSPPELVALQNCRAPTTNGRVRAAYCSIRARVSTGAGDELTGFTAATTYSLVDPDLIANAGVATTLFTLYAKSKVR